MKKILKILSINILVIVCIVFLLNIVSLGLMKGSEKRPDVLNDPRWQLPNYENKDYAKKIFREFYSLKTKYVPFSGWKRLPFKGKTTTIDENGNRVHSFPHRYARHKNSVRFFGGSTMWGTGVDDAGTIPALFNLMNPRFAVFNHGESGFNSRQNLDLLVDLIATKHKIDLVVFYDGVNDIVTQCRREISVPGHIRARQFEKILDVEGGNSKDNYGDFFYTLFLKYTVSFLRENVGTKIVRGLKKQSVAYNCSTNSIKALKVAEAMIKNWELAYKIVSSEGGKFMAILQPVAHIGTPKVDYLKNLGQYPELRTEILAVYPIMQKLIRKYRRDWMYDFTDIFDRNEYVYIDYCHVSEKGNRLVAQRISDLLAEGVKDTAR